MESDCWAGEGGHITHTHTGALLGRHDGTGHGDHALAVRAPDARDRTEGEAAARVGEAPAGGQAAARDKVRGARLPRVLQSIPAHA